MCSPNLSLISILIGLGVYTNYFTDSKTIGAHYTYGHAIVSVNSQEHLATMTITFTMEDMYNFNPGQEDIASGTPDAVNGRFAELGWAKEFKTYGSLTKTVTWKIGQIKSSTTITGKEAGR